MLELSLRYFDLLLRTASEFQLPLTFEGIGMEPGSARCATRVSDAQAADFVQQQAGQFISGLKAPPPALRASTDAVKRVLRALPEGHVASVILLDKRFTLLAGDAPVWKPPPSLTTFRAYLIMVGGKVPKARFTSPYERDGEPFNLDVSADLARRLAQYLYSQLEISVRIQRDEDGKIEGGKLLQYTPVQQGDALEAWRQWYRESAREWDDVVDIERELGRDRS